MKIHISKDAGRLYAHTRMPNQCYLHELHKIAGKWLEVDTKNLFKDQFNTLPTEGVYNKYIHIMDVYVDEVFEDERIGKLRCKSCGHVQKNNIGENYHSMFCPKCGKEGMFYKLDTGKYVGRYNSYVLQRKGSVFTLLNMKYRMPSTEVVELNMDKVHELKKPLGNEKLEKWVLRKIHNELNLKDDAGGSLL